MHISLTHKNLNKFQQTQNIWTVLSNHYAVKLENNAIKLTLKFPIYLESRNHILNWGLENKLL